MRRLLFPALFLLVGLFTFGAVNSASAQYFGQNKVQYDDFEFKMFSTDHFDIYFYPEEREAVMDAGRMAERWYQRHSRTFLREFKQNKPLIFYANSADFQQTNAVRGQLGQGTGGVTERNVVLKGVHELVSQHVVRFLIAARQRHDDPLLNAFRDAPRPLSQLASHGVRLLEVGTVGVEDQRLVLLKLPQE
ncbi:MAG TPA: hypothetical protein VJ884_06490, partial [Salinibacter sp.]|nr:hypothetical protein [Salinibacter sp.]